MNFGAAVSWNALLFTPQAGYTGKVHLIDPYTGAQTDISSPSQTSVITTLDAQGQLTLTDVTTRGTRYYSSGKKVTGEKKKVTDLFSLTGKKVTTKKVDEKGDRKR